MFMEIKTYNKKYNFVGIVFLFVAIVFVLVAFEAEYRYYSFLFSLVFFVIAIFHISDKFEINLTDGKILRKVLGVKVQEIEIQSIKRYFIENRTRYSGYFIVGTHIEIENLENGKTVYKKMNTNIYDSNIRKMFSEAKKINPNIQESSKIIVSDILRKKLPNVYVLLTLLLFFLVVVILLIRFKLI